jgi:hypothetical protein
MRYPPVIGNDGYPLCLLAIPGYFVFTELGKGGEGKKEKKEEQAFHYRKISKQDARTTQASYRLPLALFS